VGYTFFEPIIGPEGAASINVPEPRVLFSRQEIEATVKRLAARLNRDYGARRPVLVGVLKGSFVFMADLIRHLNFPLEVEFVRLSSYGASKKSSGSIRLVQGLGRPIKGRDVVVVEDIVDTGLTTAFLLDYLRKKRPASLKLCVLVEKCCRRQYPVDIDYLGFSAPDSFLVGYGIDWGERFRNLPDICVLEE
jgi:hypoxanthine phosphoribosyltransferase